ncbi:MAG: glycosyltransferase family 4 protein [Opitutaceae bacterium]
MKIALVCDWFLPRIGGIERHLVQLAERLAAAHHDVTVITPTKGSTTTPSGVRVQRLPAFLFPGVGLVWTPASFRRIGVALRANAFDVVHVHSSIISPAAYAAIYHAQKAGRPTVSTGHSIWGGFTRVFGAADRLFPWTRWPVAYSSVSERVARELRPLVAPRPVDILPNAVDCEEWRLVHSPPADVIAIACVMRLAPRKRGAALLHALRTVCTQLPPGIRVCLQFAGDGPERARLERLTSQLGLGGVVRFLGTQTVTEIKSLLSRSHFFVLPSKLEAFGLAALEARAAGLPVLAMAEGGVSEFISPGKEGLLAADAAQLAQHLLRLCLDAPLRNAIAAHNRLTPTLFTWERTLAAHFATYARAHRLISTSPGVEGATSLERSSFAKT